MLTKTCLAIFLAFSLIGSACIFATSSTTVKGVVMNYDKPVEGAEVMFGPTFGESKVVTGKDGKFTITAKHRPTAMLRLEAKKNGLTQREAVEFPGFAAPKEEIKIEMLVTFTPTKP